MRERLDRGDAHLPRGIGEPLDHRPERLLAAQAAERLARVVADPRVRIAEAREERRRDARRPGGLPERAHRGRAKPGSVAVRRREEGLGRARVVEQRQALDRGLDDVRVGVGERRHEELDGRLRPEVREHAQGRAAHHRRPRARGREGEALDLGAADGLHGRERGDVDGGARRALPRAAERADRLAIEGRIAEEPRERRHGPRVAGPREHVDGGEAAEEAAAPDRVDERLDGRATPRAAERLALAALAAAASDEEETVRLAAIGYLAGREGVAATEALVDLLRTTPSIERVQAALSTPARGRVEGLARALERADDDVAPRLTAALARMHQRGAQGALVASLTCANVSARKAAAATLAAVGDPQATAALRRASTDDPDPEVRTICSLLLVA